MTYAVTARRPRGAMRVDEQPFSKQNRPWLTDACIEAMNNAYMDWMSKIEQELHGALKEWVACMVEVGYCQDHPEVLERCKQWGDLPKINPACFAA